MRVMAGGSESDTAAWTVAVAGLPWECNLRPAGSSRRLILSFSCMSATAFWAGCNAGGCAWQMSMHAGRARVEREPGREQQRQSRRPTTGGLGGPWRRESRAGRRRGRVVDGRRRRGSGRAGTSLEVESGLALAGAQSSGQRCGFEFALDRIWGPFRMPHRRADNTRSTANEGIIQGGFIRVAVGNKTSTASGGSRTRVTAWPINRPLLHWECPLCHPSASLAAYHHQ